jgi:hypothetical protein
MDLSVEEIKEIYDETVYLMHEMKQSLHDYELKWFEDDYSFEVAKKYKMAYEMCKENVRKEVQTSSLLYQGL